MRTTLTLDPDVAARLQQLQRSRDSSFKAVVNDALRRGLDATEGQERERPRPRLVPVELGRPLLADYSRTQDVLDVLDGPSATR